MIFESALDASTPPQGIPVHEDQHPTVLSTPIQHFSVEISRGLSGGGFQVQLATRIASLQSQGESMRWFEAMAARALPWMGGSQPPARSDGAQAFQVRRTGWNQIQFISHQTKILFSEYELNFLV